MPLQAGTRLGPSEILSLIGAGGMGEVYRARDTRLDRTVAVKVVAPELANDAEFRARFVHEAKAISALNHPHICGLFDIGRDNDTEYLILEFLDGETLAARLERGALLLAQVLRVGIEIADALAGSTCCRLDRRSSAKLADDVHDAILVALVAARLAFALICCALLLDVRPDVTNR